MATANGVPRVSQVKVGAQRRKMNAQTRVRSRLFAHQRPSRSYSKGSTGDRVARQVSFRASSASLTNVHDE